MKFVFVFISLISVYCFCQEDFSRWQPKTISYKIKTEVVENTSDNSGELDDVLISTARSVYKIFISDVDGDNCPFEPSCSAFFVESVKQTNLVKGALMFADRFTRDLNFLKVMNDYPVTNRTRFYDPPENYKLKPEEIKANSFAKRINE